MVSWSPLHQKLDLTPPEVMVAQHFERISSGSQLQPAQYKKKKGAQTSEMQEASQHDREITAVGDVIEQLFEKRGWSADVSVGELVSRWTEIVGADVAAHCEPKEFSDGTLTLQVSSTSWATQLRWLKPEILRKLNHEIGEGIITEINIKAPQSRSWKKGYRSVPGRGPRDTYG